MTDVTFYNNNGRDPFNQNSTWSDREKRTTSKGGPIFLKLFRLDRTDPLSFGPKFSEILVEWILPNVTIHKLSETPFGIFSIYVILTISYLRAQTIETSSLPTDSSRPLFEQIEIFSSILTAYLNCTYCP